MVLALASRAVHSAESTARDRVIAREPDSRIEARSGSLASGSINQEKRSMSRLTSSCRASASEKLDAASGIAHGLANPLAHRVAARVTDRVVQQPASGVAHRIACCIARGLALSSVVLGSVALSAPALAAKDSDVRRHPGYVDGSGFARLAGRTPNSSK